MGRGVRPAEYILQSAMTSNLEMRDQAWHGMAVHGGAAFAELLHGCGGCNKSGAKGKNKGPHLRKHAVRHLLLSCHCDGPAAGGGGGQ